MIKDIRQSEHWSSYLTLYKWVSFCTSTGETIRLIKNGPFTLAKIQRPNNLSIEKIEEIEQLCHEKKVSLIIIEPYYENDKNTLLQLNYKVAKNPYLPPKTSVIDLRLSVDSLRKNMHRSARYALNRSTRENTQIEIIPNPSLAQLRTFYEANKQTGKIKHFYVQSFEDILKKGEVFVDHIYLINSYINKELSNSNLYLEFDKNVWFLHGATTQIGQKSKSGYQLVWQAINFFKNKGFEFLDLEGIKDDRFKKHTKGWQGITKFKLKFGGTTIIFPEPMIKPLNMLGRLISPFF